MTCMQEARYYKRLDEDKIQCQLCAQRCRIDPGQRGICQVRENQGGRLVSLVYGMAVSKNHDPIEKKPLFHVFPGTLTLSVATVGCNFRCRHCQNHDLSQYPKHHQAIPGRYTSPQEVVTQAVAASSKTISFTYSEPTVFIEWAQDIGKLAAEHGIQSLWVTNGYTEEQPLGDSSHFLLAANVDLKSFRDEFYQKVCGARLQPVLDTILRMRALGIWVEVTTLLIPGLNDDTQELTELASFLVSVDANIPWHLSRFHPDYELRDRPATPLATIQRAREIGLNAGLRFVYSGNVWGDAGENTYCPTCRKPLIRRVGFAVVENHLDQGHCPHCLETIAGVWE